MMKIAVNTRFLLKNRLEGIGWFTYEIFRRLAAQNREVEFHFIFDRRPDPSFQFGANVHLHVMHLPARHVYVFPFWYDVLLKRKLAKINPDIFVAPDSIACLTTQIPQLLVLHDINFMHHPEWLPSNVASFYTKRTKLSVKKVNRLATVSAYSANDIASVFGVAHEGIDIIPNGVNEIYKPLEVDEIERVRQKHAENKPYFVYVGSLHARKNIEGLLQSFELFSADFPEYQLLMVGSPLFGSAKLTALLGTLKCKDRVKFLGRLAADEVHRVVGASSGMIFIPHFEGFGIPVLEAFACGVPLIASNTTSIPEVAGDAAILVPPTDHEAVAGAMKALVVNEELRQRLIHKGSARRSKFSWDASADAMWKSIHNTLAIETH